MKTMESKTQSICAICGKVINRGDMVARFRGAWYHKECAEHPIDNLIKTIENKNWYFSIQDLRNIEEGNFNIIGSGSFAYRNILIYAKEKKRVSEIRKAVIKSSLKSLWSNLEKEGG